MVRKTDFLSAVRNKYLRRNVPISDNAVPGNNWKQRIRKYIAVAVPFPFRKVNFLQSLDSCCCCFSSLNVSLITHWITYWCKPSERRLALHPNSCYISHSFKLLPCDLWPANDVCEQFALKLLSRRKYINGSPACAHTKTHQYETNYRSLTFLCAVKFPIVLSQGLAEICSITGALAVKLTFVC